MSIEITIIPELMAEDESFQCPSCKCKISPADMSNETYRIVEANDETVLIECQKCHQRVRVPLEVEAHK